MPLENAVSPCCGYFTKLSFMVPEAYKTCKHKALFPERCTFPDNQHECPRYGQDPNYPVVVQFRELEEKFNNIEAQLQQNPQDKNTAKVAYNVLEQILSMSKERIDLFGGMTSLYYSFKREELRRQFRLGNPILERIRHLLSID